MTEQQRISRMHTGIVIAVLEKRARINAEIAELVGMLRRQYEVDDDWILAGSPQDGFALVPPEAVNEADT